jgi:hypothetical protein
MQSMSVYYHPDNYPSWILWKEFDGEFEMIGEAGAIDAGGVPTARPGFAPRVSLGKPQDGADPTTSRRLRRGYDFQVKFVGTGHVIIDRFRIHAQKQREKSTANSHV